jgi:alkylation response protein AidB-like acyl-CoA dehydrogenase
MCLAPASAASVFDTWDVSGLRGTGSCDWALNDHFVPASYTFDFPGTPVTQPGSVYRLPALSTFTWSVSVVPLALARACLDAFVELARDRTRLGTSQPLREREIIQSEVGRADAKLRSARALLVQAMTDLMDAVDRRTENLVPARADLRLAAAHAAETALQVAATLESAVGAAAIFENGPLASRLRDLRAAVQHVAMSPNNFTIAGRLRLGLEPGTNRI